ncbi:SCO3242 family prenyltransferase [Streptomyces jumonjinensis]|uniref:SCO3242 family prenyltransferase n=1 Tax=Streptomyces jumonjinensis TaxID=1945 RepID=UPI0037B73EBA
MTLLGRLSRGNRTSLLARLAPLIPPALLGRLATPPTRTHPAPHHPPAPAPDPARPDTPAPREGPAASLPPRPPDAPPAGPDTAQRPPDDTRPQRDRTSSRAEPSASPAPTSGGTLHAWAELLRVSALSTVPGDALTGAAALGLRPNRRTALALGASLCLYQAGMALNDWADREEDAHDRPHRPIPSGRITPTAALTAATVLTTAGLTLAARAGRPALAMATALAATVWAYDLRLKHTPAGPAAMATARALDLLLGATATRPAPAATPRALAGIRPALPPALLLGAHTYAVTSVSRHEAHGGSTLAPLAALTAAFGIAALTTRRHHTTATAGELLRAALATTYVRTAATPLLHAALNPSPPLTQRAVGGGIRAMIPLQAALAARPGDTTGAATALAVMGLAPLARTLARKVSPT